MFQLFTSSSWNKKTPRTIPLGQQREREREREREGLSLMQEDSMP